MNENLFYDAFISYNHRDCGKIAPEIQKGLERIGVSKIFKGKHDLKIFRDETDLSVNAALWPTIESNLQKSKHLILLASPNARQSIWVKKEVDWWLKNKSRKSIFIIVADGEISWNIHTNQFEPSYTTCIPAELLNTFDDEPLWIDLRKFNNDERKVSYQETDFKSALIKIIAAITNRSPRDIDSEDQKRQRKTINLIYGTVLAFIILVLFLGFLYIDKNKTELISLSNSIWAAGDRFANTDYSKTLRLYSYAYSLNPDTIGFRKLKEFYESKTTVERYSESRLKLFIDTFNFFSKTLPLSFEPKYSYYKDEELGYIPSLKYEKVVCVDTANIILFDLKNNQTSNIPFNSSYISIANNESQDLAFVLTDVSLGNKVVFSFDKQNNKIDTLWRIGENGIFFKNRKIEAGLPDFSDIMLSDDGKFLFAYNANFIIYEDDELPVTDDEFYAYSIGVLDFTTGEITKKTFKVNNYDFFGLEDIQVSSNKKYIYLHFYTHGNSGHQYHLVCDFETQKVIDTVYDDIPAGENIGVFPTSFKWLDDNSGYLFGRFDGKVIHTEYRFNNDYNKGFPDDIIKGLLNINNDAFSVNSIAINKSFIVAGTTNGVLKFWDRSYFGYSMADLRGANVPFTTAQLPTDCPIEDILINDGSIIYAKDACGNIFLIDSKQYIILSESPNTLLAQIQSLNIDDLTEEEKERFKIHPDYKIPSNLFVSMFDFVTSLF